MGDYKHILEQKIQVYDLIIEEPDYMKEYFKESYMPPCELNGIIMNRYTEEYLHKTGVRSIDIYAREYNLQTILYTLVKNDIHNPIITQYDNLLTCKKIGDQWGIMFHQNNNCINSQKQLDKLLLEIKEDLFLVGGLFLTYWKFIFRLDLQDSKIDIRKSMKLHKVRHINIYFAEKKIDDIFKKCISEVLFTSDMYLIDGVLCADPYTFYGIPESSKYHSKNIPLQISFKKNKPFETNNLSIYTIDTEIHEMFKNKSGKLYVFGENLYTESGITGLFVGLLDNIDYKKNMIEYDGCKLKFYKINDIVYDMYNLFQKSSKFKEYVKTESFVSELINI
jgi:hypothetical protein